MTKLNLGSGSQTILGWDNLDLYGNGIIQCDLRKPLPYPNESVTHIYSEHFIEHLDEVDGFNLIKESFRVLMPGGRIRISCPDLRQYVEAYLNWNQETRLDKANFSNGVNYLNYAMLGEARGDIKYLSPISNSQDHGHRYFYDEDEMRRKLAAAGFKNILRCRWNQSSSPELCNLETRYSRDLIMEAEKEGNLKLEISKRSDQTTPADLLIKKSLATITSLPKAPQSDFDEATYLAKYPDIASGVSAGSIPSGEWHYKKYGEAEGRTPFITLATNQTEAWKAFKACAKYHQEAEDFSLFEAMMEKIEKKENFHVARYNDGEWVFMLRIEPFYSRFIQDHGHKKEEIVEISEKLLKIIDTVPNYYIGIDSSTRALKNLIESKGKIFLGKIAPLKNLIYGDIFNAATIRYGIEALLNPLKNRCVIMVGPEHMKKLELNGTLHLVTPINNCWNQSEKITQELETLIRSNLNKNPVILYSCSFLAKLLVDINYHRYDNQICQLDIGSCIDPWCGYVSRPWHIELAKHYHLKTEVVKLDL